MPPTKGRVLTLQFGVLQDYQISKQQIGNQAPGATAVRLNRVDAAAAARLLVFDVVAEKHTEFGSVGSDHLREVILPDEKILVIVPRRLVPQISITASSPADSRNSCAFHAREDGREGGCNRGVESPDPLHSL